MKRLVSCALISFACLGLFVGCGEETKVKSKETTSGPGGSTTTSKETKVTEKGSNPPAPAK